MGACNIFGAKVNPGIYRCQSCHLLFTLESDKEEHQKQTGHSSYQEQRLENLARRGHISETIRILESAMGGISKMKLMYSAYVTYSNVKQYVNLLVLNGLLEYDSLDNIYRTTEKGTNFLNTYKQICRRHKHDLQDL